MGFQNFLTMRNSCVKLILKEHVQCKQLDTYTIYLPWHLKIMMDDWVTPRQAEGEEDVNGLVAVDVDHNVRFNPI